MSSEQAIPWWRQPPVFNLVELRLQKLITPLFFDSWVRRIALHTHQDQANGDESVIQFVEGLVCMRQF
jgi:hypothetical protein